MSDGRRVVRCAIYTRKSSEEGLEQDFNSLDAQFEAGAAYVASQKHEGWKALPARYDDGGYSGGTLERPALKRLYWLLTNPIYAGRIRHRDQSYQGQHPPLIDPAVWDQVQTFLMSHPSGRVRGRRNVAHPSPLAGRIVDEIGERLSPSHAKSGDGRRRYYVSKHLIERDGEQTSSGWRLPAVHVEQTVASIVIDHLGAAGAAILVIEGRPAAKAILGLDHRLKAGFDASEALALVEQVRIAQGQIDIQLSEPAVASALDLRPDEIVPTFLQISHTFQMRRRGVETRLLLGDNPAMLDNALLKFVARAQVWWEQIRNGSTLGQLAEREGFTKRLIGLHLPAAFLAPDILELIVDGRQPPLLTAQALRTQAIPSLWDDQRVMFGIANPVAKIIRSIPAR